MPANIETVELSSVSSKFVNLKNHQMARTISMSTWTTMRIAILYSIENGGVTFAGTPRLTIGLNNGTTNLYGDATTSHFVGWRTAGVTLTHNTDYYQASGFVSAMQLVKRVGTTLTTASPSGGPAAGKRWYYSLRSIIAIEIVKGSPNYTIRYQVVSAAGIEMTYAKFVKSFELPLLSDFNAGLGACFNLSFPSGTIAVDEATDGTLDSVYIGWDRTSPGVRLDAIGFGRMA